MIRRCQSLIFISFVLCSLGCQPEALAPPPVMELRTEAYAEARQSFRTQLLWYGPAAQVTKGVTIPPTVEEIPYTSGEWKLKAYVDRAPADGGKRPAVLFLHGGYAFDGSDPIMPQPFRDAGFIVMIPVLRGENGLRGCFSLMYDEVDDVLSAAQTLAALPYVDSERLFVAGHEAGGTLALLAAMTSDRFRAAASCSAWCDQYANHRQYPGLAPLDPANVREFQMRSPVAYAGSFKCPARLYYGSEEASIAGTTQETATRARAAGRDVAAVEVRGGHFTAVPESLRIAIEFFRQQ